MIDENGNAEQINGDVKKEEHKGMPLEFALIFFAFAVIIALGIAFWISQLFTYKSIAAEQWNDTTTGNCENSTLPRIRLYNQSYCNLDCGILKGVLNISMATQLAMPPQKLNIPSECNYTCYGELVGWSC